MTAETKSAHLAQLREKFVRTWAPWQPNTEFQIGLDQLIYAAFACAQEPFIAELNLFKEHALRSVALGPLPTWEPPQK